jgi:hypothetical protein
MRGEIGGWLGGETLQRARSGARECTSMTLGQGMRTVRRKPLNGRQARRDARTLAACRVIEFTNW